MPFDLAKAQKLAETAVTLKNEFLKTANWRREQAIDYPDDKWNFEAVALLDRLANTVDEIDPRLLEAVAAVFCIALTRRGRPNAPALRKAYASRDSFDKFEMSANNLKAAVNKVNNSAAAVEIALKRLKAA